MHTIDIDFDVFKVLTSRRETEAVTYNDVLRRVLDLDNKAPSPSSPPAGMDQAKTSDSGGWVAKGVTFPAGTEFRASYKGQSYYGSVEAGALVVQGKRFESPSAAAGSITGNPVNGWLFWECRLPGKAGWQAMKSLRKAK